MTDAIAISTWHFFTAITADKNALRHQSALQALRRGAEVGRHVIKIYIVKDDQEVSRTLSPLAVLALRAAAFPEKSAARRDAESLFAHIWSYYESDEALDPAIRQAMGDLAHTRGGIAPHRLTGAKGPSRMTPSRQAANIILSDAAVKILLKAARGEFQTHAARLKARTLRRRKRVLAAAGRPRKKAARRSARLPSPK